MSNGQSAPQAEPGFHHSVETDPESGWKVHRLSYRDPAGRRTISARIVPEAGSNLISLEVDGSEILHTPPTIKQSSGVRFGFPILYPTPNRVRDAKLTFDGRTFEFQPNNGPNFIHGLVHSVPWRAGDPVIARDRVSLSTTLDFDEGLSGFARFPIRNRLTMTFTLHTDGVTLAFEAQNLDKGRLPFGFAFHPYFKILGERAQTFLRVPARRHMEAVGLLPTGKLEPLEGSPLDVRSYTSLEKLNLDDVYIGMVPGQPAGYEARDRKVRVALEASEIFTHAVVYTPTGRTYFCIENQTCSTDAHNLHARGLVEESHLIVLEPGQRAGGSVRVRVSGF